MRTGLIQQCFVEEQRNHPAAPDFRKRLVGAYGDEEEPVAAIESAFQHDGMPVGFLHCEGAERLVAADHSSLDRPARCLAEIGGQENTLSVSRSPRFLPVANCSTDSAASIMCRMRTRSSLRILDLRGANHLISEVAAKVVGGSQVNTPPSEDS